jgi:gamma-glutamylcyclotransferase (GGCT)/AIG2-like uncharacterized protein YtfP
VGATKHIRRKKMFHDLFVYGTLKTNGYLHGTIKQHVLSVINNVVVRGILINLGIYPGMIDGNGVVKGQILTISDHGLKICHQIEGYRPDEFEDSSLYVLRQAIILQPKEMPSQTMAYFYNIPMEFRWDTKMKDVSITKWSDTLQS